MEKFYITLIICLMMIPLIPFSSHFAVGASSPLYTHFIYMFGHASFIHWLCNAWSLLVLHNVINYHRTIAAWIFSVLASFVLILDRPVLGASVFVSFFMGMITLNMWKHDRITCILTIAMLVASCFLPGFAGIYHIILFLLGMLYYQIERLIMKFKSYAGK
nr:hypothetical protein [uncultured Prevotella sp.]